MMSFEPSTRAAHRSQRELLLRLSIMRELSENQGGLLAFHLWLKRLNGNCLALQPVQRKYAI